jgi:hypothetical protein
VTEVRILCEPPRSAAAEQEDTAYPNITIEVAARIAAAVKEK